MAKCGTILLVSGSSELHRVMGPLASAYNLSLISAETAKEGLTIFKVGNPNCVIFDLRIVSDPEKRARIKNKLKATGVPILFLNDSGNGIRRRDELLRPLSLEPIVRFVVKQSGRLEARSPSGFWDRVRGHLRPRHA